MPYCNGCNVDLPSSEYSGKQLKRKGKRKCKKCVATIVCGRPECDKTTTDVTLFPSLCTRCHTVRYCTDECRLLHWQTGHGRECGQQQQPQPPPTINNDHREETKAPPTQQQQQQQQPTTRYISREARPVGTQEPHFKVYDAAHQLLKRQCDAYGAGFSQFWDNMPVSERREYIFLCCPHLPLSRTDVRSAGDGRTSMHGMAQIMPDMNMVDLVKPSSDSASLPGLIRRIASYNDAYEYLNAFGPALHRLPVRNTSPNEYVVMPTGQRIRVNQRLPKIETMIARGIFIPAYLYNLYIEHMKELIVLLAILNEYEDDVVKAEPKLLPTVNMIFSGCSQCGAHSPPDKQGDTICANICTTCNKALWCSRAHQREHQRTCQQQQQQQQ